MKKIFVVFLTLSYISLHAQNMADSLFQETAITLETATGQIFGTMTVPRGENNPPVVLIIAGSGPTDRDGNSPMGVKCNTYKLMSQGLAEEGIASVRYDKRGIAASVAAAKSEADLRFDDYIQDVIDWVALLRSTRNFSGIFVAGHSEGSTLGMIASETARVAGYISIAGAGRPIQVILKEQLANSGQLNQELTEESNGILDSLSRGMTVNKVNPILAMLYRPSIQPYMISWMKYDPSVEITKLTIPVLIVQGTTDIQVKVEDAELLAKAKPDATLLMIENMNHVLKEAPADVQANMTTYNNPDLPLKPEFLAGMIDFIKSHK